MSKHDDLGHEGIDALLQKTFDRKRLLGSAVLGAAGVSALAAPTGAFAAARRGLAPTRGSRPTKTGDWTLTFAAAGSYQGFNPDKPATIASRPSRTMVIACYDRLIYVVIPLNTSDA